MRRYLTLFFAITLSFCTWAMAEKPNVLFIMVDDMGWTGLTSYGSDLHETPRIDGLAEQGVRFTQAYSASPVCTPTRSALMSGQHPARLNITIWHEGALERRLSKGNKPLAPPITEPNLALEYTTIAEVLHDAGYQTAHVGKWHLGDANFYPETQGFDATVGGSFYGAPITFFYPYKGARPYLDGQEFRYIPGLPFGQDGEYLTDRLTDEALGFMDEMHQREKPFFLYMSYYNPHTPIEGKPELVEYYKKKIKEGMTHNNAHYAAMVKTLDENVGRLLDKVDALGEADNTLVIFYSDNGGFEQVRRGEQVTNNIPLRSGKGSAYEGGIRVPLIVKWPGVTPKGKTCEAPVTTMDFYPTLLEALGLDAPKDTTLDGVSLAPVLRDPSATLPERDLHWHYPHYYPTTTPVTAIRHGDWKLLEYYEDGHLELFNLKEDLGETTDLAQTNPEMAKKLHDRMDAWRKRVNAQLPTKNDS